MRDDVLAAVAGALVARRLPHPLRVGVDGISAAGKTTFADDLARAVGERGRPAVRVTLDDFHHVRERRHRRGRLSAEGYYEDAYDYETAARDLLVPLGASDAGRYRARAHDLETDAVVDDWRTAPPDAVVVVDGSFLLRPELRSHWDELIFLDVSFDAALTRGLARDAEAMGGPDAAREAYASRYHAAARRYLAEADPRRHATVVIDHDDPQRPVCIR